MIERVVIRATIVLSTSLAGFLFYVLFIWFVGRRRLHEPFTLKQFGIDLLLLSGGLVFLSSALQGVILSQDVNHTAFPIDIAQGLNVAKTALAVSAGAIAIGGGTFMVVDSILRLRNGSI